MAVTALGLSEKQRAMRPSGIGASEIAAVAGLHPTRRPIDVYREKVGEAEPFEGNEFTEWGHRIERVVAEAWAERHPDVAIFTPGTLRHRDPRYPFAFASPDRVVVERGRRAREAWRALLEIKNVSTFQAGAFGEAGTDEVPEHMLCQVQWQLEVTDLEPAELVPLIGGHDFRSYPIRRDRDMGGMLLEIAARFWVDNVTAHVPPDPDASSSYTEYLRARFPREAGPVLAETDAAHKLAHQVAVFRRAAKVIEERKDGAENALKALIGTALGFEGLCTWKANKDGTAVNADGIAYTLALALCEGDATQALAVLAQVERQFTQPKPGARVLRITKGV